MIVSIHAREKIQDIISRIFKNKIFKLQERIFVENHANLAWVNKERRSHSREY
tara:strand:+ start:503 stop:661 length:159 start_codon:yes stop_codon:yes gene_type:complete